MDLPYIVKKTALLNAKKSSFRQRLGATIFSRKKIHSWGFNKAKSHPITKPYHEFGTIHAEIDAILQSSDPCGKDLFVVRLLSCGELAISRPCDMCVQIMAEYGIKNAYYINRHGNVCCESISQMLKKTMKDARTTVTINKKCPYCEAMSEIIIDREAYDKFLSNSPAEVVFKDLTADERELIKHGICDHCSGQIFE